MQHSLFICVVMYFYQTQNNFACDIGRTTINMIEVILFLIIYSGHVPFYTRLINIINVQTIRSGISLSRGILVLLGIAFKKPERREFQLSDDARHVLAYSVRMHRKGASNFWMKKHAYP